MKKKTKQIIAGSVVTVITAGAVTAGVLRSDKADIIVPSGGPVTLMRQQPSSQAPELPSHVRKIVAGKTPQRRLYVIPAWVELSTDLTAQQIADASDCEGDASHTTQTLCDIGMPAGGWLSSPDQTTWVGYVLIPDFIYGDVVADPDFRVVAHSWVSFTHGHPDECATYFSDTTCTQSHPPATFAGIAP